MPLPASISVTAIEGLPEIGPGDDLANLIAMAITEARDPRTKITDNDVLVIAHKVVSKSEGRIRRLADVQPGSTAIELAEQLGKDPRHVQVILAESREVLRASHGVLISVTHHGFICANAGVDASNVPGDDALVLLPRDPEANPQRTRSKPGDPDHRFVRPGLAPRAGRRRDRLCRPDPTRGLAGADRRRRARAQGHLDRGRGRAGRGRGPRPDQGRRATRDRRARCRPARQPRRRTWCGGVDPP